jgi:hypothetical protein
MLINGTGAADQFTGLLLLTPAGQKAVTGANGKALDFAVLDELIDLVVDKDGDVDYFMMHSRTIRSYYTLLRGLGGASVNEVIALPSGREVPGYRGVPMFRNDWNPINQVKGTGTNQTTIFAGTLDDGSRMHGISGLTASQMAGINVVPVGESETKDESITRIKWYAGLALAIVGGVIGQRIGVKKGRALDDIYREVAWELKHEAEAEAAREAAAHTLTPGAEELPETGEQNETTEDKGETENG